MSAKQIKRLAKKQAEKLLNPNNKEMKSQEQEEPMQTQNEIGFQDLSDSCEMCSSGSESDESVFDFCDGLAKWAIQFQISFVAINALLLLLLKCNIKVPKDARTLLKTPASVIERKVGDGTYVHYGLKNGLTDFLVKNNWNLSNITLDFGIDGLPLFKSSSKH